MCITITPLGTVSTYCYQNKNCPGFLVEYNNHKILLDCGNGISKNLNLPNDFNNLTIIISHLHPDHYGELLSLAQTTFVFSRLGYIDKKIKVYIPEGDKIKENNIIDFDYLLNLEKESFLEFLPYNEKDKLHFDDLEVCFARNPHPLMTYSTKLETDKLKLVYSSDTGYKGNSLEKFAKDANLLICESTFLKGQTRNDDNHLFAHEAAIIAKNANVDKLLLTHFWPTIDKQKYVDEAKETFESTEAAEENKKLILKR